jgi:hypothetical protein
MTEPASVISDGNVRVQWVPSIADPEAPNALELNDPTGLDLTYYLTDSGWAPNMSEDTVTDPRLCSRQTFTRPGRNQTTLPLAYVYNPENPDEDEARLTLVDRATGFIVARWGDDYERPFDTGDIVDVYPVQMGRPNKQAATANTPLTIMQTGYVKSPGAQIDVVVTAS